MNAPVEAIKLDIGIKRCRDCVHCIKAESPTDDRCGYSVKVDYSTGTEGHFFCETERERLPTNGCGQQAIHFAPTSDYMARRSVQRMRNLAAIEAAILHHNPDASDAQEILDALAASLKERYDHHAQDALQCAQEFREALDEVEA